MTRKCTECYDGIMEGELQAVPIEMPLSSYQKKIVLTEYIPEICVNDISAFTPELA
ncbi:MAG: hypothetical protein WBL44_05575 [Nitrososphaeraceae archaeon]